MTKRDIFAELSEGFDALAVLVQGSARCEHTKWK
jgi:hypothetical protein